MIICIDCNENKHLEHFSLQPKPRTDYKTRCRQCCGIKVKEWKKKNIDKFNQYRELNSEKIKEVQAKYRRNNKDKLAANFAKYHATKLKATPLWLTKEHIEQMKEKYRLAKELTKITGIEYHVDHMIPLKGEGCCGLHIPWNLRVITAKENLSKGNRWST